MPLVVPDTQDAKADEWSKKLVGKTISEEPTSETTFCKADLPDVHRVIGPQTLVTKDHRPDRLNVYVKEDGTVSHVHHG